MRLQQCGLILAYLVLSTEAIETAVVIRKHHERAGLAGRQALAVAADARVTEATSGLAAANATTWPRVLATAGVGLIGLLLRPNVAHMPGADQGRDFGLAGVQAARVLERPVVTEVIVTGASGLGRFPVHVNVGSQGGQMMQQLASKPNACGSSGCGSKAAVVAVAAAAVAGGLWWLYNRRQKRLLKERQELLVRHPEDCLLRAKGPQAGLLALLDQHINCPAPATPCVAQCEDCPGFSVEEEFKGEDGEARTRCARGPAEAICDPFSWSSEYTPPGTKDAPDPDPVSLDRAHCDGLETVEVVLTEELSVRAHDVCQEVCCEHELCVLYQLDDKAAQLDPKASDPALRMSKGTKFACLLGLQGPSGQAAFTCHVPGLLSLNTIGLGGSFRGQVLASRGCEAPLYACIGASACVQDCLTACPGAPVGRAGQCFEPQMPCDPPAEEDTRVVPLNGKLGLDWTKLPTAYGLLFPFHPLPLVMGLTKPVVSPGGSSEPEEDAECTCPAELRCDHCAECMPGSKPCGHDCIEEDEDCAKAPGCACQVEPRGEWQIWHAPEGHDSKGLASHPITDWSDESGTSSEPEVPVRTSGSRGSETSVRHSKDTEPRGPITVTHFPSGSSRVSADSHSDHSVRVSSGRVVSPTAASGRQSPGLTREYLASLERDSQHSKPSSDAESLLSGLSGDFGWRGSGTSSILLDPEAQETLAWDLDDTESLRPSSSASLGLVGTNEGVSEHDLVAVPLPPRSSASVEDLLTGDKANELDLATELRRAEAQRAPSSCRLPPTTMPKLEAATGDELYLFPDSKEANDDALILVQNARNVLTTMPQHMGETLCSQLNIGATDAVWVDKGCKLSFYQPQVCRTWFDSDSHLVFIPTSSGLMLFAGSGCSCERRQDRNRGIMDGRREGFACTFALLEKLPPLRLRKSDSERLVLGD